MPLQNRVLPTGEIVADPARGRLTGNRGILHRADGTLGISRWTHPHWVACTLTHPRGVHHGPMPRRGWTALFFLDEAVALAAGHRPCAYCRREDFIRYRAAWGRSTGEDEAPTAPAMDAALHRARVTRNRAQVRHIGDLGALPDGCFVLWDGRAHLVLADCLLPFAPEGYGPPIPRPIGAAAILTPAPTVAVLRHGYRPGLHPSAGPQG